MHELGVVFHIAKKVETIAAENDAKRVCSVNLEIGEVSTVIPTYLLDVWKWNCKKTPLLNDCELKIDTIHATTYCEDCKQTYDTVPQGRICPYCESERTYLLTGNEFNIKEITVE